MSLKSTFDKIFGRKPQPPAKNRGSIRMYQAAKDSRLTAGWGQLVTSADTELITSLRVLRSRSRALVRDAAYAKRAKVIVVNNVVGSGMGVQALVRTSRGALNDRVNSEIEDAWKEWSRPDYCHVGGVLGFADMERMAMGQVFEAGEIFIRKHYQPFGSSPIPFALEIIEAERVVDEWQPTPVESGARLRMGIEMDQFYRPLAYWIRKLHPGEVRFAAGEIDLLERVPADQIIHLRIVDRWPQTRGEPWMHTVVRKLNDMDSYTESELVAARGAASYMGIIETAPSLDAAGQNPKEIALEPGVIERLDSGEKFTFVSPNRPNAHVDPFFRLMLREVAAGTGCSYESLSRDYSQSNYSSSRLALIDDRDLWRMVQAWFVRNFREPIHREWLQQAVLAKVFKTFDATDYALAPDKFSNVRFKPRGWSWIDPTKEVLAYKEAIRCGFTTTGEVIGLTGGGKDLEDVMDERRQELDQMKAKELLFDTDPTVRPTKLAGEPVSTITEPTAAGAEQGATGKVATGGGGEDVAVGTGKKNKVTPLQRRE